MSVENPIVKFSPFEALLIGEKNKIIKRRPLKNTIFVTSFAHHKKTIDLRVLFDLKEEVEKNGREDSALKVPEKIKHFIKDKKPKYNNNLKKSKKQSNHKNGVCHYPYKRQSTILKENEYIKFPVKDKKAQSNKTKFKPNFRYKETLEERIVNKIQKRNKKLQRDLVSNGVLTQIKKRNHNRHMLRDKSGKFIRKDEFERIMKENAASKDTGFSNCLHHLYTKKNVGNIKNEEKFDETSKNDCQQNCPENVLDSSKKIISESIFDDVTQQYCENSYSNEIQFPPLPKNLPVTDFEEDRNLIDIIYENHPKDIKFGNKEDFDDFSLALENAEILCPSKVLKMYERKKSVGKSNCNNMKNVFNNSTKENKYLNGSVNVNNSRNLNESNAIPKKRRNNIKRLIDEPPTKDNHLISRSKLRSLFYKTASGNETYLGNFNKPVLLNSPFGRLPDIS